MDKILVIGAGVGAHSLHLQNNGFNVHALEILPGACEILKSRGQKNIICADFFQYESNELYNTIILFGRNIGISGTLKKLEFVLNKCSSLLNNKGIILLNSWDMMASKEKTDVAYYENKIKINRYYGEVKYKLEYNNVVGEEFEWLYIDKEKLVNYANKNNFSCEILYNNDDGDYLAKLDKINH